MTLQKIMCKFTQDLAQISTTCYDMLSHGRYDMRYVGYDNHKNFILSQLAFLENVSHYSLIRIFTIFL